MTVLRVKINCYKSTKIILLTGDGCIDSIQPRKFPLKSHKMVLKTALIYSITYLNTVIYQEPTNLN